MSRMSAPRLRDLAQRLLNVRLERCEPVDQVLATVRRMWPRQPPAPLVRYGPQGDGGYLVPDLLSDIDGIVSPGVAEETGFEMEIARQGEFPVLLADASVSAPTRGHKNFHFIPKFLGRETRGEFITMEQWISKSPAADARNLLLQMDIEGFEYEVLLSTPSSLLNKFKIIVIELHKVDRIWSESGRILLNALLDHLGRQHSIIHLHANNAHNVVAKHGVAIPTAIEITLLRNDFPTEDLVDRLPHELDCENVAGRPPVNIPATWHPEAKRGQRANG